MEDPKNRKPKKDSGIGRINIKKGMPDVLIDIVDQALIDSGLLISWDEAGFWVSDVEAAVKLLSAVEIFEIHLDDHGKEESERYRDREM